MPACLQIDCLLMAASRSVGKSNQSNDGGLEKRFVNSLHSAKVSLFLFLVIVRVFIFIRGHLFPVVWWHFPSGVVGVDGVQERVGQWHVGDRIFVPQNSINHLISKQVFILCEGCVGV